MNLTKGIQKIFKTTKAHLYIRVGLCTLESGVTTDVLMHICHEHNAMFYDF